MAVTFVKQATASSASSSTSVTATFASATTAGNLLVICLAGDKNTGTASAAGFTSLFNLPSADVSLYYLWGVSTGQTSVTASWTASSAAGNMVWVGEFSDPAVPTGNWSVQGSASAGGSSTSVTSQTTGTTGVLPQAGLAVACAAVDSSQSVSTVNAWTNGFTSRYNGTGGGGKGGIFVAQNPVAAGTAVSTTFSFSGSADQVHAAVAVFRKAVAVTSTDLPIRAAFYYPWFTGGGVTLDYGDGYADSYSGSAAYFGAWTQGTYPWTQYHPKRGYYDSASTSIIDAHIGDMVYGKFAAGIVSWWGAGSREDGVVPSLLARAQTLGSGFKWCLYYEMEGNTTSTPGSPDPSVAQIVSDLNYITAQYTGHPNYLHVDDRPVIFVYGGPEDDSTTGTDITDRAAYRWHTATRQTTQTWYTVLKVYDVWEADNTLYPSDSWHQYAPAVPVDVQGNHARSISPRFWRGDNQPPFLPELARPVWQQNIRDMLAGNQNWKLVTSYNEWGEGHSVEAATGPSSADLGTNPNRVYAGSGWDSASGYGWLLDDLNSDGAPTNPAKSLAGAVAAAGLAMRTPNKRPTGVALPAGIRRSMVDKVTAGLVGAVGTKRATIPKLFGGIVAGSGLTQRGFPRALAGVLAAAGLSRKTAEKAPRATISPVGMYRRTLQRIVDGTTTGTGLSRKTVTAPRGGSITPTATTVRLASRWRMITGTLTPTARTLRLLYRRPGGSITPAGVQRRGVTKRRLGVLAPFGNLFRASYDRIFGRAGKAEVTASPAVEMDILFYARDRAVVTVKPVADAAPRQL
jgi:hypothetical protein